MSIFHDKAIKSVAEAAAKVMAETSHELKGNQHKIDANKNGKVDAHDFKLLRGKKDMKKEEVEQLDEVGDTPAGRKALGSYVNKAIDDKSKDRTKGLRKATSRLYKDNFYGKKNEEVEMNEEDAYNKDRYAVKNGKATKDNPTHMGSPNYKDQPHHVWATSAEHAMKKSMKKEDVQQLDEAFPTVADAKKRMDAGKTATGSVTKTKTGLVHKRDYKDDDNDSDDMQKKAKGYGARQNYKRSTRVNEAASFTEMLELYNEHGLKVLAPIETEEMDIDGTTIEVIDGDKINGYVETTVEEEVTNDEFTKEYEDQKASFEGKKKQPKVAAGKTTGVKEMPESVELEERELSKDEAKKKEEYVKGMKKGLSGFKERYGERAKSVMYGAATNMAKKD
jgi:hypothetical protein